MRWLHFAILAAASLSAASPALSQDTDGCGLKWSVAREIAALSAPDLPTLATGGAPPALGHGAAVTLSPQADVAYSVKPARAPKANPAYGAELSGGDAGSGGSIQVTMSTEGWIDVIQDGKVLRSAGFSGKATCAGIRKSVRFKLAPGPFAIAISDAPEPTVKLAVVPVASGQ